MKYALLLPFIAIVFLLSYPDLAMTQDLGRHLKVGEIIVACKCVPDTNLFSFVEPNHMFINHHWFSEVLMYMLHSAFGLSSLLTVKILSVLISFGIVLWIAYQKSQWYIVASLGVLYAFIFSERFYTRPELISFLFLSVFLWCIYQYQKHKKIQYLIALPFLEIVWVNSHIYFPVGAGLVGLLVVTEYFKTRRISVPLLFIGGASLLAMVINPHGVKGALYPLTILNSYGYTIVENQNIFFLNTFFFNPRILMFEIIVSVFFVLIFLLRRRNDLFWMSVSTLATLSAFLMIRNFSLFVLATLPYFVWSLNTFMSRVSEDRQKAFRVGCVVLAVISIGWIMLYRFSSPFAWFSYAQSAEKAVDFYKNARITGPIFNNFDIGGYLIYTLYPQEKVFVDGRPEAYSVASFDRYKRMQEDSRYFATQAKTYNVNAIVFAHTDITPWAQKFLSWITQSPDWTLVYLDQTMIILVKNTEKNAEIIQKYKVDLPRQR